MLIYKYNGFGKLSLEKLRAFIRPTHMARRTYRRRLKKIIGLRKGVAESRHA